MKPNIGQGDKGETSLFGPERVKKNSLRIEAYGTVDELNSFLGLARVDADEDVDNVLQKIQEDIMAIGSDLATPLTSKMKTTRISADRIKFLEQTILDFEKEVKPLTKFILPAGNATAARLQVARAVCRRAERRIVSLVEKEKLNENTLAYVNRLSDVLFTLARVVNKRKNIAEKEWKGN